MKNKSHIYILCVQYYVYSLFYFLFIKLFNICFLCHIVCLSYLFFRFVFAGRVAKNKKKKTEKYHKK